MKKNIQWLSRCMAAVTLGLGLFACEKGSEKANLAPSTTIAIDKINLAGSSRLVSTVQLNWTGFDQDGYVTGFEISKDGGQTWATTTKSDSLFRFSFSPNTDTTDIHFLARAIDNDGQKDATPASLIIPIKNTPPTVRVDSSSISLSDTVFSVLTMGWNATDSDGDNTLQSVSIKINDGDWYNLSPTVKLVSFVPETPMQNGATQSKIYQGYGNTLLSAKIAGLRVGDTNRVYIKAQDAANTESLVYKSKAYYVARQKSDLLVIDTHNGTTTPTPEATYLPLLSSVYTAGYDRINMLSNNKANQPKLWNTTFALVLGLYKKVFWYSDDSKGSVVEPNSMPLESATATLQNFLNNGGKVFITSKFPDGSSRLSRDSQLLSVLAVDSIAWQSSNLRLLGNRTVTSLKTGFPNLRTLTSAAGGTITGLDVFYTKADSLYECPVSPASGTWTGANNVSLVKNYSNGRTNLVFFSVELHLLNGDAAALNTTFNKVLNEEFNW
ncbi:hypothetical protein [Flexibacter flexilis]|nr:hypothetical protein [Flexibacter flexilis]